MLVRTKREIYYYGISESDSGCFKPRDGFPSDVSSVDAFLTGLRSLCIP
jgi:hypothetical protein